MATQSALLCCSRTCTRDEGWIRPKQQRWDSWRERDQRCCRQLSFSARPWWVDLSSSPPQLRHLKKMLHLISMKTSLLQLCVAHALTSNYVAHLYWYISGAATSPSGYGTIRDALARCASNVANIISARQRQVFRKVCSSVSKHSGWLALDSTWQLCPQFHRSSRFRVEDWKLVIKRAEIQYNLLSLFCCGDWDSDCSQRWPGFELSLCITDVLFFWVFFLSQYDNCESKLSFCKFLQSF